MDEQWRAFIEQRRSDELAAIIRDERLREGPAKALVEAALRDGYVHTEGTAITRILPPTSRFRRSVGDDGHDEKKRRVQAALAAYIPTSRDSGGWLRQSRCPNASGDTRARRSLPPALPQHQTKIEQEYFKASTNTSFESRQNLTKIYYTRPMKYLSQVQWAIYSITLSVLILIVCVGASSLWPLSWSRKLHDAATVEVKRRREVRDTFSQPELAAMSRLIGDAPKNALQPIENNPASLKTIATLMGQSNSTAIISEIEERRGILENAALRRQVNAVENISDIIKAARLWRFYAFINICIFTLSGIKWFFPRSIEHLKKVYAKHITNISIAGAIIGIFIAYLKEKPFDTNTSNFISTVGNSLSISFVAALILSTMQLFHSVFSSALDLEIHRRFRNVTITGIMMLFIFVTIFFSISGKLSELYISLNSGFQSYLPRGFDAALIGAAFMTAILFAAMWNALKYARMRELNASSRLYYLAAIPFVFTLLFTITSALLSASPSISLFWIKVSALTCVITLTAGALVHLKEWVLEYRYLLTHKLKVKNFGFRWWALAAWVVGAATTVELENILANPELAAYDYSIFRGVLTIHISLTLILTLSFIPGLVITILFFRRVHKVYNGITYSQASKHPLSDQNTNS